MRQNITASEEKNPQGKPHKYETPDIGQALKVYRLCPMMKATFSDVNTPPHALVSTCIKMNSL